MLRISSQHRFARRRAGVCAHPSGRDPLAAAARFKEHAGVQFVSPVFDFESAQLAETGEFLARFGRIQDRCRNCKHQSGQQCHPRRHTAQFRPRA